MAAELFAITASYEQARLRRAELLAAIQGLEEAVAAPAGYPAWPQRVRQRLGVLRDRFAEHIVVTEGPDGLYAELLEHAPRLSRPVARLTAEHDALLGLIDRLVQRLSWPDFDAETTRAGAGELLAALSRHRQSGADLVYEAYATDIGGET